MSMKNSIDAIGKRTRDLRTYSAVPQPNAPSRTPEMYVTLSNMVLEPVDYELG